MVHKRRIAMLRAQGHVERAIEQLVAYVDRHMCDYEAWAELADLYVTQRKCAGIPAPLPPALRDVA